MSIRSAILLDTLLVAGAVTTCWTSIASATVIVDESGKPVSEFQAMYNTADQGCTSWQPGKDGVLPKLDGFLNDAKVVDVLVRAKSHAGTVRRFEGEQIAQLNEGQDTITLERGQTIKLQLQLPDGMEWPDGFLPEVYFADIQRRVQMMRQPSNRKLYEEGAPQLDFGLQIEADRSGAHTLQLADDTPPFFVGTHRPGFLQYFDAGPFTLADAKEGVLTVEVPHPAELEVRFEPTGDKAELPFHGANVTVLRRTQVGSRSYWEVATENSETPELRFKRTDLAPGDYRYALATEPNVASQPVRNAEANPGKFHDIQIVRLQPGEKKLFDVRYQPINLESYRGSHTARLRFEGPDQAPATGEPIAVRYIDPHYGGIPVFKGELPASGEIVINDLTAVEPPDWFKFGAYAVSRGDKHLGYFSLAEGAKESTATFYLPPQVGDVAPNVDLVDVTSGEVTKLASLRGKVVWIEFWATWCGPCQPAMKHLVELSTERGKLWADRVALVPLSIDDTPDSVRAHNEERGWNTLPHYWASGEGTAVGFDSRAARAFGVDGVPTAFLIDAEGRILWSGHPMGSQSGETVEGRIAAALE